MDQVIEDNEPYHEGEDELDTTINADGKRVSYWDAPDPDDALPLPDGPIDIVGGTSPGPGEQLDGIGTGISSTAGAGVWQAARVVTGRAHGTTNELLYLDVEALRSKRTRSSSSGSGGAAQEQGDSGEATAANGSEEGPEAEQVNPPSVLDALLQVSSVDVILPAPVTRREEKRRFLSGRGLNPFGKVAAMAPR